MSIRLKVIGTVAITFIVIFAALFIGARLVVLSGYEALEMRSATRNVQRIQSVLDDNLAAMVSTSIDWAHWDDSYSFALGEYPDYVADNMSVDTIANLDLNMMLFFDTNGDMLYGGIIDLANYEAVDMPEGFEQFVSSDSPLVLHPDPSSEVAGFVRTPDFLVMVASTPILTNAHEGPVAGSLVLARFLDEGFIESLAEAMQVDVNVLPVDSNDLPEDVLSALTSDAPLMTRVLDQETIRGYGLLNDISGQPIGVLVANMPREIFAQGLQTIRILGWGFAISALVVAIATALVLESVVSRRVTRLAEEVDVIQAKEGDSHRVTVSGDDEVSRLGTNINAMLDRLDANRQQLRAQNDELKIAYAKAEDAARLKGEFLSTMSHELRTPLNAVIGYAGIMLEGIGGEIDDDAREMVTNINDSSNHLLKLINDVLDISKIESGRFELVEDYFSIPPMVESLRFQMNVLPKQKGLDFNINVAPEVPEFVKGDKERIKQIIINLLGNAFKFTDKGSVGLNVLWQDERLIIKVSDTGIGIPPHALQYIFEQFRQVDGTTARSYQGTGLGLSIVKKLANAMKGDVTVESVVGEGTTFTVWLPLQPALETELMFE